MSQTIEAYPEEYRKQILFIAEKTEIDYESAMAIMTLMAALMDLRPTDEKVTEMILADFRRDRKREKA